MIIFLDTETTGLEDKDKIVSIALVIVNNDKTKNIYELINDGKKIPALASSINHISNEMIKGKCKIVESEAYKFLQKNNLESTTIIGHNVKFDLEKLSLSGFDFIGNIIDTLRVTKHLIPECDIYSLQFLRYELRLYKLEKETRSAHHALDDAVLVKRLYEYLLDISNKEEMIKLSFKKVLMQKFAFGKYNGRYIEDISVCDRGYLEWMCNNIVDLDEDLRYSVNYYLSGEVK
ncbi:MAG: DNA polymerase III subunit epsilon [Sulfurimonas sp.]|nr:MAG: DNA polymerase III subunit epsilon [Sulfurimonas sp.]